MIEFKPNFKKQVLKSKILKSEVDLPAEILEDKLEDDWDRHERKMWRAIAWRSAYIKKVSFFQHIPDDLVGVYYPPYLDRGHHQ